MSIKVKSNAKINLFLKVIGLENEYHLIESIFVPINIYDILEFIDSDKDEILGMDIPMENNLIYKTICILRNRYNVSKHIKVLITKEIPLQAGLGGGSSNAAFTIKALNSMWNLKMANKEMKEVAALIGSDVPFFIDNEPSIVTGRGQYIEKTQINNIKGILIFDKNYFSTKEVYKRIDSFPYSLSDLENIRDGKYEFVNDLEKGIDIYKDSNNIYEIKKRLKEFGATISLMSGSGGSVFGIFDDDNLKEKALKALRSQYYKVVDFKNIK